MFNFRSLVKALPRYSITIISLLVLGGILTRNLNQVITNETFKKQTYGIIQAQIAGSPGALLQGVSYDTTTPKTEIVRAVVRGPYEFTSAQVAAIASKLPNPPNGLVMDFRLRFVQTTVITPTGYLYTDSAGP
jgi:hypothetical protein